MKVDGISAADMSLASYNYVDPVAMMPEMGLTGINDTDEMKMKKKLKDRNWRFSDLQFLLDKLKISQNKYMIIRLLRRGDIMALLHLLGKDQLMNAMSFFPRSKLLQFIHHLPKEIILKMLLWAIPLRQFLQFFPMESLFNILRSKRLEVGDMVKNFENMPLDMLRKLLVEITGQKMDGKGLPEMKAMLFGMRKDTILEGMKKMGQKDLFEYIHQLVQKDPELMMMIPKGDLMKMVTLMPKPNLLELFRLLDESTLVKYLMQLPDKFLALAAAQLDDKQFGNFLISQFPDLVAALAAAA